MENNNSDKKYYEFTDIKSQKKYQVEKSSSSYEPISKKLDIFDLTETEFSSFFYKEFIPNLHFSKIRGLKNVIDWWVYFSFTFVLVVFLGTSFLYFCFFKDHPIIKDEPIFGLFILIFVIFSFFGAWSCLMAIITAIKVPNYKIKQKLFSALNIKYLTSKLNFKQNDIELEMFSVPASVQKALRKIFVSSKGRQTRNFFSADESLYLNYKGLPLEIVEFQYPKDSKDFSKAIVIATKISKNFKGEVIINEKLSGLRPTVEIKPQVFLEVPESFSKFKVFADDQVEARYLLTTAFLNRMIEYKKAHNCSMDVLFSNEICDKENVFICISSKKDFFEFSFFSKWDKDPTILYGILQEIKQIAEVVDALRLDQDIGM